MVIQYRVCCVCCRLGTREFHKMMVGKYEGQWRCDSTRSCEERDYQNKYGKRRDRTYRAPWV